MTASPIVLDAAHRVIAACALAAPLRRREAVAASCAQLGGWRDLERSASMHQLRPVLQRCLGLGPYEPPAASDLARAAGAYRGQALLLTAELVRILDAFRVAGIRVAPFKGPVFAAFHDEGPEGREMGDLDLVIEAGDLRSAAAVLGSLGFAAAQPAALASNHLVDATNELGFAGADGHLLVELHWRFAPPWCGAAITPRDVFDSATDRAFCGVPVSWPGAEELFLVHVTDGMKSGGFGMRWLGDLAAIVRTCELDWLRVRTIAERNGGLNLVRIACAVMQDFCDLVVDAGLELPEAFRRLAEEARARPRLATASAQVRDRLAADRPMASATETLLWALRISDRPSRTIAAILRYLVEPAMPDLAAPENAGLPPSALRMAALRRRAVGVFARAR